MMRFKRRSMVPCSQTFDSMLDAAAGVAVAQVLLLNLKRGEK